jgi:hypothetical protein
MFAHCSSIDAGIVPLASRPLITPDIVTLPMRLAAGIGFMCE